MHWEIAGHSNMICLGIGLPLLILWGARQFFTTIHFVYDALYRLVRTEDPNGNTSTVSYDGNGNVIQKIDRMGRSTTISYDALNRVKIISYPDAVVVYTYDNAGRITRMDDSES